jgi:hypothetical protein
VGQHLSFTHDRKATEGYAKVRTGLGKPDRPGSQGGLRKRGLWLRLYGHIKRKRRNRQALTYGCAHCISIPTRVAGIVV